MGIFGAMTTAVSGLAAQSYALENISGNIANSQTSGFKRIDTSFVDLIPDGAPKRELAGSVTAQSRATNTIQGQVQASGVNTNLAINGSGYFIVQQSTGSLDNQPVFSNVNYYTRRGDFTVDANGYMVNGAGYYLRGLKLDPTTGNPSGSSPTAIQITNDVIPAKSTSAINYRASLPSVPATARYQASVAGSELIDPTLTAGAASYGSVPGDAAKFVASSVSGGSITAYDPLGNPVNVQVRWTKTANASAGPPAVEATWNAYYQSNSGAGTEAWTRIGSDFTFNGTGQMTAPTTSPTISNLTVNGVNVGNVKLDIGSNGISQYARTDGSVLVTTIDQNGYSAGKLANVTITDTGRVRGNYTNGQALDLFQIPLATFQGENSLKRMDGGAFGETAESGSPILGGGGKISSNSLEGSNVDISEEFTKLIVTQQAYASNTRIVTTANAMLQETINMIR
ncbi:flagellar hook protein FlgE [Phreatobacter stygius]|uniref:Flagellar hook protein FlgE n=1 Tax=Phreatobacter stygius TaxID=1940610 RepID=A0A4D7AVJ8_9HYPH|nr:flagellar hook protein FlgE [Phreatobacter stygius]QCI63023.1 flagellar hook protein FlgE [Phreatobacter stygius]